MHGDRIRILHRVVDAPSGGEQGSEGSSSSHPPHVVTIAFRTRPDRTRIAVIFPFEGATIAMVSQGSSSPPQPPIAAVVAGMRERLGRLPERLSHQRIFLSTYQRTTLAVGEEIEKASFEDPRWVERWDVVFAELYLTALDTEIEGGGRVPRPWRLAFAASPDLPPLRHVLLGINAHVNYDLPQALLAVISEDDFTDPLVMDRRRRDHERIDKVLAERVGAEDDELTATGGATILDRLLTPLNRLGSKRFLREARQKVWHNTLQLQEARLTGPEEYAVRLGELELLSTAKIADLLQPGQVLLRLAVAGFGVTLPPSDSGAAGAKNGIWP